MEKGCVGGGRVARCITLASRLLRHIPLPFDAKFALLVLFECASCLLLRMSRGQWREQYNAIKSRRAAENKQGERQKIAVVTDGLSPAGKIIARELHLLGYFVVLGGKDPKALAESIKASFGEESQGVSGLKCAMDREESVISFVAKIAKERSHVDLLVLNETRHKRGRSRYHELMKKEKKVLPSKGSHKFITKQGKYRDVKRILLEKNEGIKVQYRHNFLVIRGLSSLLRNGDGRLVVLASSSHNLVRLEFKQPLIPSLFYLFCYGKLCNVLLGLGAKARYEGLDVRIVHPGFRLDDLCSLPPKGLAFKVFSSLSMTDEDYAMAVVLSAIVHTDPAIVNYYNYVFEEDFDGAVVNYDGANDFWEQAEVLS